MLTIIVNVCKPFEHGCCQTLPMRVDHTRDFDLREVAPWHESSAGGILLADVQRMQIGE
jgi:hypothetical protein